STNISTTADAVLAGRRGVCQDFAHLLIALNRCLGLPARYISGYCHDPTPPSDALLASHAWAEVFPAARGSLRPDPTPPFATAPRGRARAAWRPRAPARPPARGAGSSRAARANSSP